MDLSKSALAILVALTVTACANPALREAKIVQACKTSEHYNIDLHSTVESFKISMHNTYSCIRRDLAQERSIVDHPQYDLIMLYYSYMEAMDTKIADGEVTEAEGRRLMAEATTRLKSVAAQRQQATEAARLANMQAMFAGLAVLSTIQPAQPTYSPGPIVNCVPTGGSYRYGFTCY